jgi:hypothetical protein
MTENNIPEQISSNILNTIKENLNPPYHQILLKLFSIHLAVGAITLGFCPQMGISTFKTNINLMHYFMYWGTTYCDIFCGIFFTSTSMLTAYLALSFDEKRVVRSKKILSSLSLILSSLGLFIIYNPRLFIELSLLWVAGAFIGAILSIELGQFLSLRFKAYSK